MAEVSDYRGLISGYTWYATDTVNKPVVLTYSFDTAPPAYFAAQYPGAVSTFSALTESEKAVVRSAIQAWSDVSGVIFLETAKHQGDITFAFYNLNLTNGGDAAGLGGYPSSFAYTQNGKTGVYSGDTLTGGDVWFDTDYRASASFAADFKHVALHEIGHALGLKHPFDTTSGHPETLSASASSGNNTVMSYDQSVRADHLGPLDIAAVQYIYGNQYTKGQEFSSLSWDPGTEHFTAHGTGASEYLRGTGTDDTIYTEGGHDLIYTAQGNDTIVALGQVIDVNGGPGVDTVITGFALNALSDIGGSGDFRYIYRGGEFETLISVERLVFTNTAVALDIQGNAGNAYRLYQAALARAPDTSGLSWHIHRLDTGTSFHDDAVNFLTSPEFGQRYGVGLSDRQYVTALYSNVLGRGPDEGGLNYWLGHIADRSMDWADVLTGFSESPENHQRVDPSISAGIYIDYGVMA